jgi:hypothetical protein
MSRSEIEHLYRAVMPAVRHALEDHDEFRAFGAALGEDGKVVRIEPRPDLHDGGPSGYVLAVHAAVQSVAAAQRLAAACVCTEIQLEPDDVGDEPDGVRVHLEDADSEVVDVLIPYRRAEGGEVEYGEIVGQEAERKLIARR